MARTTRTFRPTAATRRLRPRSSAASATLASRTKPTTPLPSRRSSSRTHRWYKRGRENLSRFFWIKRRGFTPQDSRGRLSLHSLIRQARKYEAPSFDLRNSLSVSYGLGTGRLPRPDGPGQHGGEYNRSDGPGPTSGGT